MIQLKSARRASRTPTPTGQKYAIALLNVFAHAPSLLILRSTKKRVLYDSNFTTYSAKLKHLQPFESFHSSVKIYMIIVCEYVSGKPLTPLHLTFRASPISVGESL